MDCQRWLARPLRAANSTGVNSFCSIHPSVRCHVTSTSTPAASERNIPHPNILAPTPRFDLDGSLEKEYLGTEILPPVSNQSRSERKGIKVEWLVWPVQRLLAGPWFDVVVRAHVWLLQRRWWDKPDARGQAQCYWTLGCEMPRQVQVSSALSFARFLSFAETCFVLGVTRCEVEPMVPYGGYRYGFFVC